jgi:hypothetical protein
MEIETIATFMFFAGIGAWNAYLLIRIKMLEESIPTAEDIAKEVIKVKIPLADLPPELQEQFRTGMPGYQPPQGKNPLVG